MLTPLQERESLHAHRYELVINYRNHPAIIDLPSRWFYESKLKSDVKPFACEYVHPLSLLFSSPRFSGH